MEKKPLISVILPVYNSELYISRCIESVLSQTFTDFELIIINDGSTDETENRLLKHISSDKRIIYTYQQNAGVSASRNKGINLSNGDFITFIDSDDYINPDYLEKLYEAAMSSNFDIVVSGCIIETMVGHGEYVTKEIISHTPISFFGKEQIKLYTECHLYPTCSVWGKLFRAKLIRDNIKFVRNSAWAEDLHFFSECLVSSKSTNVISYSGYHYLLRKNSLSRTLMPFEQELNSLMYATHIKKMLNSHFSVKLTPTGLFMPRFIERAINTNYNSNFKRQERLNNLRKIEFDDEDIDAFSIGTNHIAKLYKFLVRKRLWFFVDILTSTILKR